MFRSHQKLGNTFPKQLWHFSLRKKQMWDDTLSIDMTCAEPFWRCVVGTTAVLMGREQPFSVLGVFSSFPYSVSVHNKFSSELSVSALCIPSQVFSVQWAGETSWSQPTLWLLWLWLARIGRVFMWYRCDWQEWAECLGKEQFTRADSLLFESYSSCFLVP